MKVYFADYFNIDEKKLEKYGAFNISLCNDMPMFVDPFLLYYSAKSEYKELHEGIIKYLVFLKNKSQLELNPSQIKTWFMFPEEKHNWLGYSIGGNAGSGLGKDFANNLIYVFKEKFKNFGIETISDSSHLEKLCLINEGVGKDYISDFTVNLIKNYLLEYTEKFAKTYMTEEQCGYFWVEKIKFDYETEIWERKQYYLPQYDGDYIILTPKDILTRETSWINREDMYKKFENIPQAIENDVLRFQINQHFNSQINILNKKQPTKEERNKAILSTIREFPEILDFYIKEKENDGENAVELSERKVINTECFLIENAQKLIEYLKLVKFDENENIDAYEEAKIRVEYLKDAIENKDCYKLLYKGEDAIGTEKDLQLLFRMVCMGSKFDINAEVNNGRGPVDYKVSFGAFDTSLVEFKLAKSSKLEQNLKNQVEIYKKANNTNNALKVIVYFNEKEQQKLERVLKKLGLENDKNIIIIDARKDNKTSASNVK